MPVLFVFVSWLLALGVAAGTTASSRAADAGVAPRSPQLPGLPANLYVDPALLAVVQLMVERSPHFRRQCQQIAATPRLHVSVAFATAYAPPHHPWRAHTVMRRFAHGHRIATVFLKRDDNLIEHIAHELEHVCEWLDGMDYAARARVDSSVWRLDASTFETSRAKLAGRTVRREVETALVEALRAQ